MRKAIYLGYAPISCVLNFQCPICEKTFGLKFKDHYDDCKCPHCGIELSTGFQKVGEIYV